jgi:hypothetical protein
MPGKRSANLGQGYRCEYMAQYALSAYASVVPILLQEDYGHDFYCLLTEKQGAMLIPRFPFFVQVKKNDSGQYGTLTYDNEDSINWFFGFNLPFFIGLGYLDESPRLDLYKTSERIALSLSYGLPKEVTLHSGKNPDSPTKLYDENNIWMGDPIITIKLDHCGKPDGDIADALTSWVELEVENLVLQSNGITRFYRCKNYGTNKRPDDSEINGKDWFNTGGITENRAEKFGSILHNMALWIFAGQDIESPKTPWTDTTPGQQKLYESIATLLQFLSKDNATRLSAILKYPVQEATVTPAIKAYSGTTMTASVDVD